MASARYHSSLILGSLLLMVLLNGCATSTPQKPVADAAPQELAEAIEIHQKTPQPSIHQAALNAYEENDYQAAVMHFRRSTQKEVLPNTDLYYFAKALYETGDYAAAVKIYTQYLTELGRRGDYYLTAINERNNAAEKLQQQQTLSAKATQAETTFKQIAESLKANWLVVKVQTDNRVTSFTEPLTGIEMILVPGGCYQMGDLSGAGNKMERPVHQVCLEDFYLGKYEVTQAQWQKVMGYNPSQSNQGDDYPVESISWAEAVEFTKKLSGEIGSYRLPTEAEWEFAARSGGKKQKFSGSDSVAEVSWYEDNSAGQTHPVGQKKPNGLGFYDMSGNVYEWCFDFYRADYDQASPLQNPTGAGSGTERSLRGGGWDSRIAYQRTSYRRAYDQVNYRDDDTGFRLTLPVKK